MASKDSAKVDKRSLVVVGELPQDFLRIFPAQDSQSFDPALWCRSGGCLSSVQNSVKLSITICQAQLAKNYGLTRMDPYCRITVGCTVFETPTAANGARNPVWNKVIIMAVPPGIDRIYLDIFDERAFTDDSRFAWAHITVPEKVFTGEQVNDWFPLSGKQGEHKEGAVNLIFTLLSDPTEAVRIRSKQDSSAITGNTTTTNPDATDATEEEEEEENNLVVDPEEEKEKVSNLKDMFPDVEEVVIVSILEANNGNMDASINSLLDIQAT